MAIVRKAQRADSDSCVSNAGKAARNAAQEGLVVTVTRRSRLRQCYRSRDLLSAMVLKLPPPRKKSCESPRPPAPPPRSTTTLSGYDQGECCQQIGLHSPVTKRDVEPVTRRVTNPRHRLGTKSTETETVDIGLTELDRLLAVSRCTASLHLSRRYSWRPEFRSLKIVGLLASRDHLAQALTLAEALAARIVHGRGAETAHHERKGPTLALGSAQHRRCPEPREPSRSELRQWTRRAHQFQHRWYAWQRHAMRSCR